VARALLRAPAPRDSEREPAKVDDDEHLPPPHWRVFLRGKPTFEDMSPKFKDIAPVSEETVAGSVLLSSQSNQRVCDNTGYCYNKTVTTSTRVPQDVKVLSGGGTVCFANAGHLNKGT
jgi:hypothetical protein